MAECKTKINNCRVTICNDYVKKNPDEIQMILKRVSDIVSGSYKRSIKRGVNA